MTDDEFQMPKAIYVIAINEVIKCLGESDYRDACGWHSVREMEDYNLDMAMTIQKVIENGS